jgi:chaperone modulatory protein CbpM
MNAEQVASGVCLGEQAWLELDEFARACGVDADFVLRLVDEDLVRPPVAVPRWLFGGDELARVRRIRRLQRDFEANLQSVAVMLDLLDEIERLRAALQRAGLGD